MLSQNVIDTFNILGIQISEKDRELFLNSSLDIKQAYKKINMYLRKCHVLTSIINQETINIIKCFVYLFNRHKINMSELEFIDKFLELYDLRYSKSRKMRGDGLSKDVYNFDKDSLYEIDLNDLRYVKNATCIKNGDIELFNTTSNITIGGGMGLTDSNTFKKYSGFCIKNGKIKAFEESNRVCNIRFMEDILYHNYDFIFLPKLKDIKYTLLKEVDISKLNNKQYIKYLILIEIMNLNTQSDLETLDKIINYDIDLKYLIKDLFIICKLQSGNFTKFMKRLLDSLNDKENRKDLLDKFKYLLETSDKIIDYKGTEHLKRVVTKSNWTNIEELIDLLEHQDIKDIEEIKYNDIIFRIQKHFIKVFKVNSKGFYGYDEIEEKIFNTRNGKDIELVKDRIYFINNTQKINIA